MATPVPAKRGRKPATPAAPQAGDEEHDLVLVVHGAHLEIEVARHVRVPVRGRRALRDEARAPQQRRVLEAQADVVQRLEVHEPLVRRDVALERIRRERRRIRTAAGARLAEVGRRGDAVVLVRIGHPHRRRIGHEQTEAAAQLGVTRAALSRVLNGRAAISPEMALRLEGWLGVENGGSADAWIAQQAAYDLWKARMAGMPVVKRAPELFAA